MKKTYMQPVSKVAEFEEETLIATSPNYDPNASESATEGGEDAKKFINFSDDIEW